MTEQSHIVALSGGKDSTCLAILLAEREPRRYDFVCTPTGNELPAMTEHWASLETLLGQEIKKVTCGYTLEQLILQQKCLPNHRMRWCTWLLKIQAFDTYLATRLPATVYVGLRADELDRGIEQRLPGVQNRYPLQEWGYTKQDVANELEKRGVSIPIRTDCAFCFYQTTYEWYQLWKEHPTLYSRAEAYESILRRTFRYQQPMKKSTAKWPAALAELRVLFEAGKIPKTRKMDDRQLMCSVCAR